VIKITFVCNLILARRWFIVDWRLSIPMSVRDVSGFLDDALEFTGVDQLDIKQKPELLSGNGSS